MSLFKRIMPVLKVNDLSKSADWYGRVLGFQICWRSTDDGDGENCMIEAGDTVLMLSTGTHLGGEPAFTGTLYFEMEGVRELFARIQQEASIVWPLEAMEYGTLEFGIRDPDGYTLAFSEDEKESG